jgi:hypothetical protein
MKVTEMMSFLEAMESLMRMPLNPTPISDVEECPTEETLAVIEGDVRMRYTFPNGYTASIVRHSGSYGGRSGLFEVAVLHEGRLMYDTPVTDGVVPHLTPKACVEVLAQIAALPPREVTP